MVIFHLQLVTTNIIGNYHTCCILKTPILSNSFPPLKAALNSLLKDVLLNIFLPELCFAIPFQNKNFMFYKQNILVYKLKQINFIKAPKLQLAH